MDTLRMPGRPARMGAVLVGTAVVVLTACFGATFGPEAAVGTWNCVGSMNHELYGPEKFDDDLYVSGDGWWEFDRTFLRGAWRTEGGAVIVETDQVTNRVDGSYQMGAASTQKVELRFDGMTDLELTPVDTRTVEVSSSNAAAEGTFRCSKTSDDVPADVGPQS